MHAQSSAELKRRHEALTQQLEQLNHEYELILAVNNKKATFTTAEYFLKQKNKLARNRKLTI